MLCIKVDVLHCLSRVTQLMSAQRTRHLSVPHILRNNFETFLLFPTAENGDFIAHCSGLRLSWLLREIQMCLFAGKLQVYKAQSGNAQGKLKSKKTNVPCLHAVKLQVSCIWRSSRHERMVGLGPGVQHMLQVCYILWLCCIQPATCYLQVKLQTASCSTCYRFVTCYVHNTTYLLLTNCFLQHILLALLQRILALGAG